MDAAADLFVGEICEEALDLTDPGRRGRGVVHMPAWPPGEPVADCLGLMAGHVIDDNMNVEIRRDVGLDRVQESAELARPMSGEAPPDDFSRRRIEGGEQRERAVTDIIMAAPFGLARTHWQ